VVKAELPQRFEQEADAEKFLNDCIKAGFSVDSLETRPAKRNPAPPFTTSTLQQEASRKLGYSVSRTMQVAQRLYESGRITYMRTDSVNLSETALQHQQRSNPHGAINTTRSERIKRKQQVHRKLTKPSALLISTTIPYPATAQNSAYMN
jgi:DNA topoisomerase IA